MIVRSADAPLPSDRPFEVVERKGRGHPDTICDALAEALSLELSRFYRAHFGGILHHNVDKVLLAAGRSEPRFGGGAVTDPMRIFLAGRAVLVHEGVTIPVAELGARAAERCLGAHLHALDPARHARVSTLVQPGSGELVALFDREPGGRLALANDTSCGVGFAPLSAVERLVLDVEQALNSARTRADVPALGEDVKVMAVRHGEAVELTVACATIDSALADLASYEKAKQDALSIVLEAARATDLRIAATVNAADDPASGDVYLTVTGTSAESGDDGQTGRGNRVNGLITPGRAMTMESVAGKNPVSHVGKLYNLAASLISERLVAELADVRGAACVLVSRIGQPIDEPQIVELQLSGADPAGDPELAREVERIARDELVRLPRLAEALVSGALRMDRWPLRAS